MDLDHARKEVLGAYRDYKRVADHEEAAMQARLDIMERRATRVGVPS